MSKMCPDILTTKPLATKLKTGILQQGEGVSVSETSAAPKILSESKRKISTTVEICITIDFVPPPKKKLLKESQIFMTLKYLYIHFYNLFAI